MKKTLYALVALMILLVSAAGCGKNNGGTQDLPLQADDPEVLAKWDDYRMLDGLPRYKYAGIFENIYVGADDTVVVSYVGVSSDNYIDYTNELIGAGCRLAEGSSIWLTEGMMGVPVFKWGSKEVTLVWSMNNDALDISVSAK